jgi:hypothetical protein
MIMLIAVLFWLKHHAKVLEASIQWNFTAIDIVFPALAAGLLWGFVRSGGEADRVNRGEVLGTFCGGFRRHPGLSVRSARAAVPASAPQASDPVGEACHDRYPTYDEDEPRGRGNDEGKYD